jgi:hypothetical protein
VHDPQNVHSNEQMNASSAIGANSAPQRSQLGRISRLT